MATDFVPVTCVCKKCKRLFLEWFAYEDTVGKTKLWRPKLDCDSCFAARAIPMYQEFVKRQFSRRSEQMFLRFPNATLIYLDVVHAEMFKRKIAGLAFGTIDDTFASNNQAIGRID